MNTGVGADRYQQQAPILYPQQQQRHGMDIEELFNQVRKNPQMIRDLQNLVLQQQRRNDGTINHGQQPYVMSHYHNQQQMNHPPMSPVVIQQQVPPPRRPHGQQQQNGRSNQTRSEINSHSPQQRCSQEDGEQIQGQNEQIGAPVSTIKRSRLNDSADGNDQDGWQQVGAKKVRASDLNSRTQNQDNTGNRQQVQHQQHHLPLDQLKRAVANNLPCFMVDIDKNVPVQSLPSAIIASDLLHEALLAQGVHIRPFSLVAYASSHRLKLGVKNKEDFARLISLETWPDNINGKLIKVLKPKIIPDAFALVVRFVPRNMPSDFVISEIKRSIGSADNIKTIRYPYDRPTDDYRFVVMDVREHRAALEQKRILIGNRMLPLTQFLPGNKLTYCTKCWQLGHIRNDCHAQQRCKWCLIDFVNNEQHQCSNVLRCAQCDGAHHSLDSNCTEVKNYKIQLKQQVEYALQNGALHRPPVPLLEQQQPQQQLLNVKSSDFPHLQKTQTSAWGMKEQQLLSMKNTEGVQTVLSEILNVGKKVDDMNMNLQSIDRSHKVTEEKMKRVEHNQEVLQTALGNVLTAVRDILTMVIRPMVELNANSD
jgi:hypothetical protein